MLFNNPKKVVKFIALFLGIALLSIFFATRGDAAELEIGYGKALVRGETDVIDVAVISPNRIGTIDLFAGALLIGSYKFDGVEYGNQAVVRAGFTARNHGFGTTIGVARIQHDDRLNTGVVNFNLGLSYQYDHFIVEYLHLSNAGTSSPNLGRDMLIVGWRFR